MKTFNDRVAYAIQLAGSQAKLARKISELRGETVYPSAIRYIVFGRQDGTPLPESSKYTPEIAMAVGLNLEWLATGKGAQWRNDAGQHLTDNSKTKALHLADLASSMEEKTVEPGPSIKGMVPLVSWVTAGKFCEVSGCMTDGREAEDWLLCPKKTGPSTYALRVRGVSMEPKYQDGDIVFVDPEASAEHGKNVIVRLDDSSEITLKHLIVEGEQYFIKALNPAWPDQRLIPINGIATICGVVIGRWVPE